MRFSWDEYEPEAALTLPGALGEPDLAIEVARVCGGTAHATGPATPLQE
jgi:hypothetical protein